MSRAGARRRRWFIQGGASSSCTKGEVILCAEVDRLDAGDASLPGIGPAEWE